MRLPLALVLLAYLFTPLLSESCSPDFPSAYFILHTHPDYPYTAFAAGRVGILDGAYDPSFLVVAYRSLIGKPFAAAEQKLLLDYWKLREQNRSPVADDSAGQKSWLKTRSLVRDVPALDSVDVYLPPVDYRSMQNCYDDAFAYAAKTLSARIQQFGADSQAMLDWVDLQDAVFRACSESLSPLPTLAPPPAPVFAQDRAYQLAAREFYLHHDPQATQMFQAIADDRASPHHLLARYLVARTALRSIEDAKIPDKPPDYGRPLQLINTLIADPEMRPLYLALHRLRARILFRTDPQQRMAELARALLSHSIDFQNDLWDYHLLALDDKDPHDSSDLTAWIENLRAGALPSRSAYEPESDWLARVASAHKSRSVAALAACQHWDQSHSTLWLTALLMDADSPDQCSDAIAAAKQIPAGSPAYLNLQYQLLRLLAPTHHEEAREIATALLARPNLTASERNRVLDQRLSLAGDLEEFIAFAPQKPAIIGVDESGFEAFMRSIPYPPSYGPSNLDVHAPANPSLLPDAAAETLNRCLPNDALITLVSGDHAPPSSRNDLLTVALTRALVLESVPQARRLRAPVADALPQFMPLLDAFLDAASPEDRRFSAANLVLHLPGAEFKVIPGVPRRRPVDQIQSYGGNWWCANPQYTTPVTSPAPQLSCPAFVTSPMLEETRTEQAQLRTAQSSEAKFGSVVLAYARSHPADRRVPESLHLLSRLARFSCDGDYYPAGDDKYHPDHPNYSRAAFNLLHQRYPSSPWTKKTPFWYGK